MSNVAPMANAGQGDMMAKMAMMKQRMQQPLGQGGTMPPGRPPQMNGPQQGMPPMQVPQGNGQTLNTGARMPWLGAGTRAPNLSGPMAGMGSTPSAPTNIGQRLAQMRNPGSQREQMLQEMIQASRKEPTLNDLQNMGRNHPGVPFQDLLRKVGYK
jgi:hypothetical protein